MFGIFNQAAAPADSYAYPQDLPWSAPPFAAPYAEDDETDGETIERSWMNFGAVLEGIAELQGFGATGEDDAAAALMAQQLHDHAVARQQAFDLEITQASILQKPLRICRPLIFRR